MALNKFFWPAIGWTLLITVFCLVSTDTLNKVDAFDFKSKDKFAHATFYFVFTIFWYLFFKVGGKRNIIRNVFLFAVGYGILIEICQAVFTSERSGDFFDVVANTTGSAIAILLLWLINKNKKQHPS